MSDTPQRVEVSALFLEDAKAFLARCKDEGLTTAIVAVEVPSPELAAAQSDLARLAKSNAELREALRQVIAGAEGSPTHGSLAAIARRALSNEGE